MTMNWRLGAAALAMLLACDGSNTDGGASTADAGGGGQDTATADTGTPDAAGDSGTVADTSGSPGTPDAAGDTGGAGTPDGLTVDDSTTVVSPDATGPKDKPFVQALTSTLDEASDLSVEDFVAAWTPEDAPEDFPLSYDPLTSENVSLIGMTLNLTDAERAKLQVNGFVVAERLSYPTYADALLAIYQKDLPIYVTADMALQALHASYDAILKQTELSVLVPTIRDSLLATRGALAGFDAPAGLAADVKADCDLYLTVALSLLDGNKVPSASGAVDDQVAFFLEKVAALSMEQVPIFGTDRIVDFSQFEPRGHYEEDPVLQRYFRAMMWLGRVDLRFLELDPFTGEWTFHDRQLADAWLLNAAAEGSGAVEGLAKADAILRALVGEVDYITLHGVAALAEAHSFDSLAAITTLDDATRAKLTDELLSGVWGEQKINSHWLETDPFSAESTPLPPAFAFFGQRFTVDSYVFSNVVYDHIVKDGQKMYRRLPSPLDVLFVLGNSQVLPHLLGELTAWQYQGNLHTLRFLVDWYDESFWSSNAYNLWLSALRGMNEPTTGAIYPEPMRTPAWRDRVMNTQLASWAQLRHDTLLYVKQSYTGGAGCDYPDGWVDAYPALWKALGDMADPIALAVQGTPAATQVGPFLENWKTVMGKLEVIAQKELDGSSLSEDEKDFLHSVLYDHGGECIPVMSGWYPSLYWMGPDFLFEWDWTIADVHTNPSVDGPLAPPEVLHVASGKPSLMVFTTDSCDGARAFVGPVASYYEVLPGKLQRYKDSDWLAMVWAAPPRPAWTQSFLVPAK